MCHPILSIPIYIYRKCIKIFSQRLKKKLYIKARKVNGIELFFFIRFDQPPHQQIIPSFTHNNNIESDIHFKLKK